jgi:hypothetical protein
MLTVCYRQVQCEYGASCNTGGSYPAFAAGRRYSRRASGQEIPVADLLRDPWTAESWIATFQFVDGLCTAGSQEPGGRGQQMDESYKQVLHGGAEGQSGGVRGVSQHQSFDREEVGAGADNAII